MGIRMHRLRFLFIPLAAGLLLINASGIVASALVNAGAIRVAKGRSVGSVTRALSAARAVRPEDIRPGRLVGHLLYERGDYAGAIQALSRVSEVQPPDALSMLWLGLAYYQLGHEADALRCFSLGGSAPYLIKLGDQAAEDGAYSDAEKWYMLAAQADPKSESAALSLAHLYDLQKRTEEARQWYLRAIELSPKNAQTYISLAILAWKQAGDRSQAERYLHHAIEIAPNRHEAYVWIGHLELERGNRAAAVEWYSRAIEVNPNSMWGRGALGRTLCEMGEYERGIQQIENILSRDPYDPIAHYNLGKYCYLPQGNFDEAAAALQAAIQFANDDYIKTRAYVGLGDICRAQGDKQAAVEQYRNALFLEPSCLEAQQKLVELLNPGN